MKRNHWVATTAFILALTATVFLPAQLSVLKDRQLMGGVHTETVSETALLQPVPSSLTDKLSLLSSNGKGNVAVVDQLVVEPEDRDALKTRLTASLQAMQQAGVLPALEWNGLSLLGAALQTFTDTSNFTSVRFYTLSTTAENYELYARMDADSGLIYDFRLWQDPQFTVTTEKTSLADKDIASAWESYLGITLERNVTITEAARETFQIQGTDLFYTITYPKQEDGYSIQLRQLMYQKEFIR